VDASFLKHPNRAFEMVAESSLTVEFPMDAFYGGCQSLSVAETFPGIQDIHTISTAYATISIQGGLDFETHLPPLRESTDGSSDGVDLNAVIFLENAARLRKGGMNEYAQELENASWWPSVNLGIGYAKRSPAKMNEAKRAQWKQMSYVLSSDALLFRNIPLPFTKTIPAVAWFSSQCNTYFAGQRIQRVDAFLAAVKVLNDRRSGHQQGDREGGISFHSYGACRHNSEQTDVVECEHVQEKFNAKVARLVPEVRQVFLNNAHGNYDPIKLCILRHHRFVLAYENSAAEDYITEKLLQALKAGSVPIYWGDPRVLDVLPHPDAIIHARDFESASELAAYVEHVMHDEFLYRRHLIWKEMNPKDWQPGFHDLLQRSQESLMCTVCQHAISATAANDQAIDSKS
jgi:hypothetical protein